MCMGVPMRVLRAEGLRAWCAGDDREGWVDLSLVGEVEAGAWVLTHLGAAREIVDAERADQIARALAGLRAVLAGGDLGDAFADLEATGPRLPPHLEEALREGRDRA